MRLLPLSRPHTVLVAVMAIAFLGACSHDATAPAVEARSTPTGNSEFQPTTVSRALVGVSDGTYTFTVYPTKQQKLYLGSNALFIPPNAVCDLATSSYGASHWSERCTPQAKPFTITAVVSNAASAHPSIEFQPALRFSPDKNVMLYFYVPHGSEADKKNFIMNYCDDQKVCVDESLTDASLTTYFDPAYEIVYRRIKHFSGYWVQNVLDEAAQEAAEVVQ